MEPITNRVLQTWQRWNEKLAEIEKAIGNDQNQAIAVQRLKLEHFQQSRYLFSRDLTNHERTFLPLIDTAIRKLEAQVYPNRVIRTFFRLKHQFLDGPAYAKHMKAERNANLESLKSDLRKTGFGDIGGNLEHHLSLEHPKQIIHLNSQLKGDRNLNISLHFERDAQQRFHHTAIEASIKGSIAGEKAQSFKFLLDEWPNLTAQHVKNLLEGRSVLQHYTDISGLRRCQWLELSPGQPPVKKYNANYAYDLVTIINNLPLNHTNAAMNQTAMIEKLEQGYQVTAVWSHAGTSEPVYLQADPAGGSVKITNMAKQSLTREQLEERMNSRQQKRTAIIKKRTQPTDQKNPKKQLKAAGL